MPSRPLVSTVLVALAAAVCTAGCVSDEEHASLEATIKQDGYALFVVENERQQRNDLTLKVKDADPGATYVLFYSPDAPKSVGWFKFDPNAKSRCGGDLGEHCRVGDFGYMVDMVKVPEGQTEITLRDDRCGCDANKHSASWEGYWAIMRVERTSRANPVTLDIWAKRIKDYAQEPDIRQLQ